MKNIKSLERNLMQDRADNLARPVIENEIEEGRLLLTFSVSDEKYALDDNVIDSVIDVTHVTPLPFIPDGFSGMIYHAGQDWLALNTGAFFQEMTAEPFLHFILVRLEQFRLAFGCHDIIGQISYYKDDELLQLNTKQMRRSEFIQGIFNQDIAFIHHKALLHWLDHLNLQDSIGVS